VDDAVSAEALPDGKIRVWVHIADATRWVELGTPMATEAETRAASGYAPRGVLPMFPLPVATDLMSLKPRVAAVRGVGHRGHRRARSGGGVLGGNQYRGGQTRGFRGGRAVECWRRNRANTRA
jgi:hypothetical protein